MGERLARQPAEWIDRSRELRFRFENKAFFGYAGDTISSALWANGVRVLGRSFKYHRPRGILSLADTDCNAVVESGESTNLRADSTPVEDGMDLKAVNTIGGIDRDFASVMDRLSPFFPVGFYYKAFHSPRRLFPFYEKQMRQMAGLGKVTPGRSFRHSPKRYQFCDLLVIGAGPAGLSAAITAAEHGLQVILVEENPRLGGTLGYQLAGETESQKVYADLLEKVSRLKNVELQTSTLAAGYYADNWIALVDRTRLTKLRARSIIVATGCYEQPAIFRNNDLPGVMLASAAQRLIRHFAVLPFKRGLVLAANADGYRAALDLQTSGTEVVAVVDMRKDGEPSSLGEQVVKAGIPVRRGLAIYEVLAGKNKQSIRGATICELDEKGIPSLKATDQILCDGVAISVGWAPADGLLRQAGTKMSYSETLEQYVPKSLPRSVFAAGRVNGIYSLRDQLEDGVRAGKSAAAHCGIEVGPISEVGSRNGLIPNHPYPIIPHLQHKNFVDFDEDIQLKDITDSINEGFDSPELLKRYSTFGMGPSQGKHSNLNVVRILTRVTGQSLIERDLTTARPYISPVPLGHLAGRMFSPHRQTPLHQCHVKAGASFFHAGNWLRPEYYARKGQDRSASIASEVETVRRSAGIIDVGTLGKVEIYGPDAAEFIERIYTGTFAKLQVGKTQYALMCDETGVMIDDGVAARLSPNHFYVTTTTGASDSVVREMKRWAIIWKLKVTLVNCTNTYAAMNITGPDSRQVLQQLTDVDLELSAFPFLGVREGHVAGVRARLLRVGFVGELGYEVHVPANEAVWVWNKILTAGESHGIRPFAVEAQRILRLEKGHVIIGQDSDGLTNPFEAGMAWVVKQDKPFFVGQRSLAILKSRTSRKLIGFTLPKGYSGPMPKECHLIIDRGEIGGRVTSVTLSPTLGHVVGMAYVNAENAEPGASITIRVDRGHLVEATIVKMPFYDPENARQSLPSTDRKS